MENGGGQEQFMYSDSPDQGGLGASSAIHQTQEDVSDNLVQWKASEFIDHQKSSVWFMGFIGASLLSSIIVFFVTKDILATLVVLIGAVTFGMYAAKKPRTLTYSLMPHALKVDQKSYRYDDFKSFCVRQEGALFSIILEPIKRFMPPLTIYFAGEDGEKIFDSLAQHLPHEERKVDFVENLMSKIRF